MATFTTRLGLRKPADPDDVDVTLDVSENMEKLDGVVSLTQCTSSTRPSQVFPGRGIYETDTGRVLVSNGSAPASGSWDLRPISGLWLCTESTRPTVVFSGLTILETDTGNRLVSNGTAPASGSWLHENYAKVSTPSKVINPRSKQRILDTTANRIKEWDGSTWVTVDLTDRVAALEADVPGAWTALTLQNGWTASSGTFVPSYRKVPGNKVELAGTLTGGTNSNGTVVANLPVGFRPNVEKMLNAGTNTGIALNISITTAGDVRISNVSTAPVSIFLDDSFHLSL
jgi:hypothetical protein